jgi:hypothetical protein
MGWGAKVQKNQNKEARMSVQKKRQECFILK